MRGPSIGSASTARCPNWTSAPRIVRPGPMVSFSPFLSSLCLILTCKPAVLWMRIHRIRMFLGHPDLDPDFHQQAQKFRRPLFLLFFTSFFDLLSMKTNLNIPQKVGTVICKKTYIFWHLLSHWRKKQDPDPEPGSVNQCHGSPDLYPHQNVTVTSFFQSRSQ